MCKEVEFLFFVMMFKRSCRIVRVIAAINVETALANKSLKCKKNYNAINCSNG